MNALNFSESCLIEDSGLLQRFKLAPDVASVITLAKSAGYEFQARPCSAQFDEIRMLMWKYQESALEGGD